MTVRIFPAGKSVNIQFPYDELDAEGQPLRLAMPLKLGAKWRRPFWNLFPTDESHTLLNKLCSHVVYEDGSEAMLLAAQQHTLCTPQKFPQAPWGRVPKSHQFEALQWCWNQDSWALFMDMGTGKTKVGVDMAFGLFSTGKIKACLVLAPKAVCEDAWVAGLQADSWKGVPRRGLLCQGSGKDKAAQILHAIATRPEDSLQFIILNYDALISPAVMVALRSVVKEVPFLMLCDESTRIKHHTSKRSKAVSSLRDSIRYRGILTGSPVTETLEDIFGQYLFLDPSIYGQSYMSFRAKYCILGGYEGRQIIGYQNKDEYIQRLYRKAFRVSKDECTDLPPKVYTTRHFDMSEEQAKWHKQMAQEMVVECGEDTFNATITLTKFRRLQEITSGYIKQGEQLKYLKTNPKLEEMLATLEEASDEKVIIWCQEKAEIKLVVDALTEREKQLQAAAPRSYKPGVVCQLHGGIVNRQEQIDTFKAHDGRAYMVINPQTGGMGLTLVEASLVIFYSNMFSSELRIQAEDRCHRIGQTKSVTYVDLVAKDSIDEYVLKVLKKKGDLSSSVVDQKEVVGAFAKGVKNGRL